MVESSRTNLIVQGGPNSGQTIPLSGRPLTLGRRPDNDVVVDSDTVSRRHALIMVTADGYVLRDLTSTNGTFVNKKKVGATEHLLKHGDQIRLADAVASFVFKDEGKATRAIEVDAPRTGSIFIGDGAGADSPEDHETAEDDGERLTGKLADLQRFLEERRGSAISREDIARHVWPELPVNTETNQEIERTVQALREQIEEDPARPQHLITVGEFGYLYV